MKEVRRDYDFFYIENFHRFKKPIRFPLRPFTIFVGPNGSGKSALSLAVKLFIDSTKVIFQDDKTRVDYFKRKEYYSLILSDTDRIILRKEYSLSKKYVEFTYIKNEDFLDISSFEYGNLDKDYNKIKLFSFNTNFPPSNYINNLTKDDFVNSWCESTLFEILDDFNLNYVFDEYNKLLREFDSVNKYEIAINNVGFITFISQVFIENEIESDYSVNPNFIRFLLFRENQFHIFSDENDEIELMVDPVGHFYKRKQKDNKREPNIIDYFVNEFGPQQIINLNAIDLIKHLIVSFKVRLRILEELNKVLGNDVLLLSYKILDEVRLEPPEFLEVKNQEILNDYYGAFDTLATIKGSMKRKFLKDLKNFEIADNITLRKSGSRKPNVNYYEIIFNSNGYKFPIKNLSSGGKQFFPILLYLYSDTDDMNVWFFVKQPELHLHPKLQMQIPELLLNRNAPLDYVEIRDDDPIISIYKNIKKFYNFFILETHSEHIIRKFQLLVASSEYPFFTNKDISIIYVQPDKKSLTSSIKVMELDEKGNYVDNWPAGFFDESAELSYALLEAQIKRKN